jgi:hypothetical protein
MNQDILLEIIQNLDQNTNNYVLVSKLYYDIYELFYATKICNEFNTQNVIPNLSNRQTYFIFDKIKNLKKKDDMNYNSLALKKKCFFPLMLCKLVNLETLGLNFGRIRTIPSEISTLINLRTLNLSCNYIYSFPNEILQLTKLENLNLSHNELEFVPDISNLTNLKILNLSYNDIREIHNYDKMITTPNLIMDLERNFNFKKIDL